MAIKKYPDVEVSDVRILWIYKAKKNYFLAIFL